VGRDDHGKADEANTPVKDERSTTPVGVGRPVFGRVYQFAHCGLSTSGGAPAKFPVQVDIADGRSCGCILATDEWKRARVGTPSRCRLARPPCVRRPSTMPVQYRIPRGSALVLSRESCGQSVLDWQNLAWSAWRSRPGHFSSCAPLVAARQCITVTANTTMMAAVSEPMTARGTNSLRCFMLTPAPGVSYKTFGHHWVRQLAERTAVRYRGRSWRIPRSR
jgi:hypothetical protein